MKPEELLPPDLLARASLRGNEYAWPVDDIPALIDAAEKANLASVGGQLQFRLPDGGTCECYWVEVDSVRDLPEYLTWPQRVQATASAARQQYAQLTKQYDFVEEGRHAFGDHLREWEAEGGRITDTMCFVWYFESEEPYSNSTMT